MHQSQFSLCWWRMGQTEVWTLMFHQFCHFQFPTEYCVCYVMSYPTLSWPHQQWVMPDSRLFWLHSEGLCNVFIFRMRQEERSLISEEMEGLNCRCICHLWNTMHTRGKCLQITMSVLYFQVNHNCFRVVLHFSM